MINSLRDLDGLFDSLAVDLILVLGEERLAEQELGCSGEACDQGSPEQVGMSLTGGGKSEAKVEREHRKSGKSTQVKSCLLLQRDKDVLGWFCGRKGQQRRNRESSQRVRHALPDHALSLTDASRDKSLELTVKRPKLMVPTNLQAAIIDTIVY